MIDALPAALQSEPLRLLSYRIQVFNSTGHSADESPIAAYAAAGQAPANIAALRAVASERGAILEWRRIVVPGTDTADRVDLTRLDLSAPSSPDKKARPVVISSAGKSRSAQPKKLDMDASNEVHLRATDAVAGPNPDVAGTVDTTATSGVTYTYSAQRVRQVTIGSHKLEAKSEPSAPVTLNMQDTFPPRIPVGLAAISGKVAADAGTQPGPYIDLSWEPNGEADLAGYRVYRQLAGPEGSPQGQLAPLTALPITAPAYRDLAVKAGQGYIYSVTAVDAAGNESAPSAKALEVAPPDAGEPPN